MRDHRTARLPTNKVFTILTGITLMLVWTNVWAVEAPSQVSREVPCALVEKVEGDVRVLDSTRTEVKDAEEKLPVYCGGWVNVRQGWVNVIHRDGQKFRVGPNTFVNVLENNADGKRSGDHLVLYRGQVITESPKGAGEFKILTPNARARIADAKALVVYSQSISKTQLIALEKASSLENRFETERKVTIKTGEATLMDQYVSRVIPTTPQPVTLAALKQKLEDFHFEEKELIHFLRMSKYRKDRKFANILVVEKEDPSEEHGTSFKSVADAELHNRKPAGLEFTQSEYHRHEPSKDNDKLREHWVKKMLAGQVKEKHVLHPVKGSPTVAKIRKVKVTVEEQGTGSSRHSPDFEKQKILQELSQIQSE